jgi:hypothetical protein
LRKKEREALRLRGLTPQQSLRMGFDMMTFARRLGEAADHAQR